MPEKLSLAYICAWFSPKSILIIKNNKLIILECRKIQKGKLQEDSDVLSSRSEASEAVVDEKLPPPKRCNAMPRNSTALDVQPSIHRIAYSPSFSKNVETFMMVSYLIIIFTINSVFCVFLQFSSIIFPILY